MPVERVSIPSWWQVCLPRCFGRMMKQGTVSPEATPPSNILWLQNSYVWDPTGSRHSHRCLTFWSLTLTSLKFVSREGVRVKKALKLERKVMCTYPICKASVTQLIAQILFRRLRSIPTDQSHNTWYSGPVRIYTAHWSVVPIVRFLSGVGCWGHGNLKKTQQGSSTASFRNDEMR
jgi:hypothetical protein